MIQKKKVKLLCAFFLTLVLSSTVAPRTWADGMVIPFTPGFGYLQVDYHHVRVRIEEAYAHTIVEQRFSNPFPDAIQARYVFPLPPGATIRDFSVHVDGTPQTVNKLSSAESELFLQEAITDWQAPSLLQYMGWETYETTLNLPAWGSTSMLLEYEELLLPQGDLYRYFYTLGTERYSLTPLQEVVIEVEIAAEEGVANVYSPGHRIAAERLNQGLVRATYRAENVLPNEHFELFYTLTSQPFGAGLLTQPDPEREGEGHFLLLLSPSSTMETYDAAPKDIVFVIDRSGSMSGEKIEQAKQALQFILGQMDENDRFAIVSFDDLIESHAGKLQPANEAAIRQAQSYATTLFGRGSTDIEGALQRGLNLIRYDNTRSEATQMIIFLTDGLPTAGITDEEIILDRVKIGNDLTEANIYVFGVGYDVNTHLLDRIARQNHGAVTYVQPGESLETALTTFYGQIAHPLLTELEISFYGLVAEDVFPRELPDLFVGSSLAIVGRYALSDGESASVHLRGRKADGWWSNVYHFSPTMASDYPFIARLWATRRIGDLLDTLRVMGETNELVDEIIALGLRYGIVTPYTVDLVYSQVSGAASEANMQLYYQDSDQDGKLDINQVSGAATVGARTQNLAYQQAAQANLALGSNVINVGQANIAQVGEYALDLNLLVNNHDLAASIQNDPSWVEGNIDRSIRFASAEYFDLAKDPIANQFMQAGPNVVFEHGGQRIAVLVDPLPEEQSTAYTRSGFWGWLWSIFESILLSL